MNDRYLFKAKRIDNGEWVVGSYINGGFVIKTNHTECVDIFENTICQCTGLKDKNGNMIWENDIIAYRDCTEEKYVIAWELDKACFEYQQYSCSIMNFDELSSCEVEVIGNVFDNPELIESEELYDRNRSN